MTPAKLARSLAQLRPIELGMGMTKLRARRTPSNQAHVTNRSDDPLLLAADAATAVAFGFREVETTVPVFGDAPSNAVAVSIGAAVGSRGVLVQCSVEEALELEMGMRGLVSYAETISLYGTEQVFIDGDDTPWSKALLTSAYASRGIKMRVTSGGGAEALMGAAEGRSMFYLEARCVALARAIGAQGVQNGGIDSAAVAGSVPGGVRSLMAENVMVMARNEGGLTALMMVKQKHYVDVINMLHEAERDAGIGEGSCSSKNAPGSNVVTFLKPAGKS